VTFELLSGRGVITSLFSLLAKKNNKTEIGKLEITLFTFKHREKCHVHTAFIVSIIVVESKALLLRLYVLCPSCC